MKKLILLGLILAVSILGIYLLMQKNQNSNIEMNPPIIVDLSLSEKPYMNRPVNLTFSAVSTVNSPNTNIEIYLPSEVLLVDGNLKWNVNISKGEEFKKEISINVNKIGNLTIRGMLKNEKEDFENNAYLYLIVTNESVEVNKTPFQR